MNWKALWSKKKFEYDDISLENLLKISGFLEMGVSPSSWRKYGKSIAELVHLEDLQSVIDFGCGCSSFLSVFLKDTNNVTGLDISESLINISRKVIPNGEFIHKNIFDFDCKKNIYDIAICNSIFQYFLDDLEAISVLQKMHESTKEKGSYLVILDVNDLDKKSDYISHRSKSLGMSIEEYNRLYSNYQHAFYNRSFFESFAEKNNLSLSIHNQAIEGYYNNNFRYNVIMKK